MVFITRGLKNNLPEQWAQRVRAVFVGALLVCASWAGSAAELNQLKVERADDGIYLSASVKFDVPQVVEDALMKGIALFFVAEADFYQSRWYWTDRRVSSATRTIRLAFQPLTRRWRINVYNGPAGSANSGIGLRSSLSQNYDSLADALASVQRFSRWKIAENSDIDPEATYQFEFKFNLDLAQLPRPFQIGVAGQKEWAITLRHAEPLQLGSLRPPLALPDKPKAIAP